MWKPPWGKTFAFPPKGGLLSDGAAWIANMAEELFPDAQHILDLYHLKENVRAFSKIKFGMKEDKYIPWAEEMSDLLENGLTCGGNRERLSIFLL